MLKIKNNQKELVVEAKKLLEKIIKTKKETKRLNFLVKVITHNQSIIEVLVHL